MALIHRSVPFQLTRVIPDSAGRYLIIQGSLLNENIILVHLYGPNDDHPQFFENLFLLLASLSGKLLTAGDFNCSLHFPLNSTVHQVLIPHTLTAEKTSIHYART